MYSFVGMLLDLCSEYAYLRFHGTGNDHLFVCCRFIKAAMQIRLYADVFNSYADLFVCCSFILSIVDTYVYCSFS